MPNKNTNGSEIHRIKEFTDYNRDQFEKLYKLCRPLVRNLSRSIDSRRFNVSQDIIQSYFWDKFLYVYNKYQHKYDEERLKATLLASLQVFKNKLLRNAYTKQAEFNQELTSLDILFDNNKEYLDDTEDTEYKQELSDRFNQFMMDNLTPDEYLVFRIELDPPPFFTERIIQSHGKLSILHLVDFFELPRNGKSQTILTNMRKHIKETLEKAKKEFKR
jgi:hypothetical protein|nr:MAG TPA: Sigma factor AlgU negative regulatory factor, TRANSCRIPTION.96A [Caudoviricetes sp.]